MMDDEIREFLSTLPARGATAVTEDGTRYGIISIHAPREGSDRYFPFGKLLPWEISIHAPREGSDNPLPNTSAILTNISIHAPREGSDPTASAARCPLWDFYPRSPRGERPAGKSCQAWSEQISIHAPREGSDSSFQALRLKEGISIHAPREGSDCRT